MVIKEVFSKNMADSSKEIQINDIQIKKTNKDISNFKHYQESKHF